MIELMFVLTTVFVAYVIYSVTQEKQALDKTKRAEPRHESPDPAVQTPMAEAVFRQPLSPPAEPFVAKPQPATLAPSVARAKAKPKTKPAVTEVVKTDAPKAANANKATVRDPQTGEIASVTGNYRFMKRWIKEALVAEGLLEKIYKNNELDEGAEARIKQALANLQEMDKYRA